VFRLCIGCNIHTHPREFTDISLSAIRFILCDSCMTKVMASVLMRGANILTTVEDDGGFEHRASW
jgi:hypothetical protein